MICSTRNHSSTTQQIWMVRAQGVYRKTQLKCQLLGEDFLDHPNFQENQGILYSPPSYKTLRRARLIMRLCMLSQLCPTFCNPMDCSPPSPSVHGILQARILQWVARPSFRDSSQPRDQTQVSCTAGGFFTSQATREAHSLRCPWELVGIFLLPWWFGAHRYGVAGARDKAWSWGQGDGCQSLHP